MAKISQKKLENGRIGYIHDVLGFAHDPFLTPVAEQEAENRPDDFFAYFIEAQPGLLGRLQAPMHFAVFGPPGSGKTMLRLTLDYEVRNLIPPPLAVTCEMRHGVLGNHEKFIVRALGTDLFIQMVERFSAVEPERVDNAATIDALTDTWNDACGRLANRILSTLDNQSVDRFWSTVGRQSVRPVPSSEPLRDFVQRLLARAQASKHHDISLKTAVQVTRGLEFATVMLLVDGVDIFNRTTDDMRALVDPFLDLVRQQPDHVAHLKLFLPEELTETTTRALRDLQPGIDPAVFTTRLRWSHKHLEELFRQRCRAARRPTLLDVEEIFEPAEAATILPDLWSHVGASPRRFLESISAAIDAHV